jgi:hypothetical protein
VAYPAERNYEVSSAPDEGRKGIRRETAYDKHEVFASKWSPKRRTVDQSGGAGLPFTVRVSPAAAKTATPSSGSLAHDLMEAAKEVEVAIQDFTEKASEAISAKIRQMITPKQ